MPTKLSKKLYRVQVYIGTENGKRIYKSFYGETKKEAEYNALVYKMGAGKEIKKATVTLRAAVEAYIESKDGVLSPATIECYSSYLRNLDPDFLACDIRNVTRLSLQSQINKVANRPKKIAHNGNGKVSAKYVKNLYGLIRAALRQNDIRIDGITLPRKEKKEYATPFEADLAKIIKAVENTSLEIPVLLASWCSLRRSEILGLQYGDIDGELLHIRRARVYVGAQDHIKTTKTESSTRTVYLPAYIKDKIDARRGDRAENDFIVELKGMSITKCFSERLQKAGLPVCRFHDLRHAFVSILAAHGIDPKWIQEQGGWSNQVIMNGVYRQSDPTTSAAISARVNGIFEGIVNNVQH